jgi:hypothetical protein
MSDYKKSAKITLGLTYFLMFVVAVLAVTLPWLITLYAEKMNRSQSLATTVMLTCYPCLPFCVVALFSMKKALKNIINGEVFIEQNILMFKRISWCCLFAGVILLIAGNFYLPFYIAGAAAVSCAILMKLIKDVLCAGK